MDETSMLKRDDAAKAKKERPTRLFVFLTFVATVGGPLLYGWHLGVLNNSILPVESLINSSIQAHYNRSVSEQEMTGWAAALSSIYVAAGALGTVAIGPLARKFGRRKPMFLLSLGALIATVLMSLSEPLNCIELLVIARIAMGLHGGIYMGLAPMYIAECAALPFRGVSTMFVSCGITFGVFVASLFGLESIFGRSGYLWILFGLPVIPIVGHVIGLLRCPSSPKYLVERELVEDATTALMRLRKASRTDVKMELDEIVEEVSGKHTTNNKFGVMDLMRNKTSRLMLLVASAVAMGQQLSGINGIIFYSKNTFVESGMDGSSAAYGTLGVCAALFCGSIVGLFLIGRVGRRPTLLMSFLIMGLTSTALTPLLKYASSSRACAIGAIVVDIIFILAFQVGPGGIGWLLTPEMFPQESRGLAVGITSGLNWICNLGVASIFPLLQSSIGPYTFLIFAALNLALFAFIFVMLRETKDKNPTEIEKLYS